jgi:hypothetical protein
MIAVRCYRVLSTGLDLVPVSSLIEAIILIGGDQALVYWDRDYPSMLNYIPKILTDLPSVVGLWPKGNLGLLTGCLYWEHKSMQLSQLGQRAAYNGMQWRVDYQ